MISFENHTSGYRVKLSGDRRLYIANSLGEMHEALQHYYGSHYSDKDRKNCPICRKLEPTKKEPNQ